jgi:hypothetical protein
MTRLRRKETEEEMENSMATIYPLVVPGHPSREERLANTDPVYPPREEPLTPAQLDELRAKAPQNPDSHSALLAKQIAEQAERRAAAKK